MSVSNAVRIVALMLMATLLFGGGGLAESPRARYEGPGYASAEDALTAYIEGLQSADLSQMIGAFAIETYVEHYHFTAYLERVRGYTTSQTIKFPNASPLLTDMNIETRKNEIVNSICWQLITFHMSHNDEEFDLFTPYTFTGSEGAEKIPAFVDMLSSTFDPMALQSMEFVAFVQPATLSEHYNKEANLENMKRQCAVYGADESRSVAAFFIVGPEPYVLCADAARFGDRWYLVGLGGNVSMLMGLNAYAGGITPLMN